MRTGAALIVGTVALAVAVLLATSLAPATGPQPADGPNETRIEQAVHQLVNDERRARDLSPLVLDPGLARMARDHSGWMAHEGTFGHGETSLTDRYARYGLKCHGAENIYAVTTVGDPYDERSVARRTVNAWLDSPGHRANLLGERFTAHGIGATTTRDPGRSTIYVTQNLC